MAGGRDEGASTGATERPDATLALPNALGYLVAMLAVAGAVVQAVAVFASGATLAGALASWDLFNMAVAAVLGALILRRRPGHVIGWILVGIGGCDVVFGLGRLYRLANGLGFDDDPVHFLWVLEVFLVLIALPQLFPDGRLLSRRWRPVIAYGAAITVLMAIGIAQDPAENDGTVLLAVANPLFASAILAGLVPMVVRFRRSRGPERQQFKWVFYGFSLGVPPFALAGTVDVVVGVSDTVHAVTGMAVYLIPASIAVAVLRYRLYDIDVVISKTLLVAGLAGFITASYVAIVVGVGALLGGGHERDLWLSLVATAAVAVAFQPVRRGLQRVANRMVYGRRATPYDVLGGFATRVGAAEPSPDTLDRLAELMADGTGADPARVWLRVGERLRPAATWPHRTEPDPDAVGTSASTVLPDADLAVPVRDRGELLGVLTIAKPRGERVTEADTDLVGRLAAAGGVVLRNLRLDAELAERLTDLDASRRRLVTAQDEARQRIEADLAGGSRARLSSLRDQLRAMDRDADPDAAPRAAALLGRLTAQADAALATLDGLAAGVYPPRLAADGLAAALTEQAGRAAVPVSVHAAGIGRYRQQTEAAVYFSVLEACQNAAKYAGATSVQVRLRQDDDRLRFEVADDGVGFDPATTAHGTGLQGITDRLDTVGGTLTIRSTPGAGTTITGDVPAEVAVPTAEPALVGATR